MSEFPGARASRVYSHLTEIREREKFRQVEDAESSGEEGVSSLIAVCFDLDGVTVQKLKTLMVVPHQSLHPFSSQSEVKLLGFHSS